MPFNLKQEKTVAQRGHAVAQSPGEGQAGTGVWVQRSLCNGRVVLIYILKCSTRLGKKRILFAKKSGVIKK